MSVKPYQSKLIPYEDEIIDLRRRRTPVPYEQIAGLLRQKYNLVIQRAAIFKFVKVRSRGHKVYSYQGNPAFKSTASRKPSKPVTDSDPDALAKAKFEFTYSERYSLKRLPKEEAAAIRKKLEAEGH